MREIISYIENEIGQAQPITGSLFNDFIEWIDRSPNTTRAYIINLRQFAKYLQANAISRPTRQDIVNYRDFLTAQGYKANTITAYLRSVKQFFAWTNASGIYPDVAAGVHAPKVDHSTHKKDALTVQEVQAIEKSIDAHAEAKAKAAAGAEKDTAGRVERATEQGLRIRAIYALAVNAGLRTIEISRANVKDLELKGGTAYLYIWGKGRSEADQKKPIAAEVAAAITDYLGSRADNPTGNSPLFVSTGNRSGGKRIAATTISTMLKRAMQEAGYDSERLTAHSLRHTAGTAVQQITGDLYQTQRYMRHASPTTTEIYLHNDTEKQDAQTAQLLYDYYHSAGTDTGKELLRGNKGSKILHTNRKVIALPSHFEYKNAPI